MAQNPPCMIEGCEIPATFTGTFLNSGQSITVCEVHFIDFAAGTLEAMTGLPVGELMGVAAASADASEASPTPDDEPASSASQESSSAPTDTDVEALLDADITGSGVIMSDEFAHADTISPTLPE